jgi:GNAT superfamily N-acetyltransferase
MKLNATDRNNFTKNNTNKSNWIKKWIREKYGYNNTDIQTLVNQKERPRNAFQRYINSLKRVKNTNMRIIKHNDPRSPPPFVTLKLGKKGYLQLEPVCANNYNRGVYIHYGETAPAFRGAAHKNARGKGIGYRLREAARNAALNSGIPLYQVSQNIEGLVKKGNLPISGRIMQSLGAHRINYAPPCRSNNLRGPYNFAFVVGNKPPKRPIRRPVKVPRRPRTLRKRVH